MPTSQKFTFPGADGQHAIACEVFLPDGDIRGIVQVSHGMCEYFGRYRAFATTLATHGYLVCGNDHLGHGDSAGNVDDLGYFSPKNGWQNVVQDLHTLTGQIRRQYGSKLPYFLFGHSMGSFLARAYTEKYGEELTAAIFCGTGCALPGMDQLIRVIRGIKNVRGERARSEKIRALAFGSYNKKIPDAKSPNAWLSRDEAVVTAYDADPHCNFNFTINGYENLMSVLRHVSRRGWYEAYRRDLPTLLIAGGDDPVGDYGRGPFRIFSGLSSRGCDVNLTLYGGARHELLNETNRAEVTRDILAFFDAHTARD